MEERQDIHLVHHPSDPYPWGRTPPLIPSRALTLRSAVGKSWAMMMMTGTLTLLTRSPHSDCGPRRYPICCTPGLPTRAR